MSQISDSVNGYEVCFALLVLTCVLGIERFFRTEVLPYAYFYKACKRELGAESLPGYRGSDLSGLKVLGMLEARLPGDGDLFVRMYQEAFRLLKVYLLFGGLIMILLLLVCGSSDVSRTFKLIMLASLALYGKCPSFLGRIRSVLRSP
jgi:hypothetical protein